MIKKALALAFMACLLGSCAAPAVLAGAAAGATIINDKRDFKTIVEDKQITHQSYRLLNKNDAIRQQAHISLGTFNHVLLVVGQAPTEELRNEVINTIKGVANISRIYNEIQLAKPTPTLTRSNDAWITTKIRTQMLLAKNLHDGQIKIVTENGSAYLMGLVTPRQADLAVDVARQVPGVQRVVKLFEYVTA